MLLIFVLVLGVSTSSTRACNNATEWACPKASKCIPIQHRCDNIPDCKDAADEESCPFPTALSNFSAYIGDYDNKKGNLEQATLTWTTDSSRFTNVTVNVTYTDGATQQQQSLLVYAKVKPCVNRDTDGCNNKSFCGHAWAYEKRCRKLCGICRRDQVDPLNLARFDMLTLLRKNVTNIQAHGWASNYMGNGPMMQIKLPIPRLTRVGGLTAKVINTFRIIKKISVQLHWTNSSIVIPQPYLDFEKIWIRYNVTKCSVISGKMVGCKTQRTITPSYMPYSSLDYNTEYSFAIKPYHVMYPDVIVGPTATVKLNATVPISNFGTKYGVNTVTMTIGVVVALMAICLK